MVTILLNIFVIIIFEFMVSYVIIYGLYLSVGKHFILNYMKHIIFIKNRNMSVSKILKEIEDILMYTKSNKNFVRQDKVQGQMKIPKHTLLNRIS